MPFRFLDQLDYLFCVMQLRVIASRLSYDDLFLFTATMHWMPLVSCVTAAIVIDLSIAAGLDVVNELDLIR